MSLLTLISIFHILVALFLVVFVLLQDPKGGGAAGVFGGGGGSSSFFGASGAGNFLSTLTKWSAIIFAITAITTTYMTSSQKGSVMDSVVVPDAPAGGMEPIETQKAEKTEETTEPTAPAEESK